MHRRSWFPSRPCRATRRAIPWRWSWTPKAKSNNVALTTNRALGDKWLVSSGLAQGDRVIVEGMQKVRPGATVKAVPFEADRTMAAKGGNTTQPAITSN